MTKFLLTGQIRLPLFVFFVCLLISLPVQSMAEGERLSFNLKNATLKQVMNEIQRISTYDFVYSDSDIATVPRRDYLMKEATIRQVITECFAGTKLSATLQGRTIVVKRTTVEQQKGGTITGKITDESGASLAGVVILVKGTNTAALSGADGKYSINTTAANDTLTYSCLGFQQTEIAMKPNVNKINVEMKESVSAIEDVIVTGIFDRPRESYTGSVSHFSASDLQMHKGQNLIATLGNIDPSINIIENNMFGSDPNRIPELTIRGNSSLPTSLEGLHEGLSAQLNAPLVIMDGFEVSLQKLMDFNDQDIMSITTLKDASATAIYGSRGANGVIVITTRKPQAGKLRLNLRVGLNLELPDLSSYRLANAREKLEIERRYGLYEGKKGPLQDMELKRQYMGYLEEIERGVNTDWLSQPVRTGVGQRYDLRIDWGKDEFLVGVNLGYNNIAGAMKGSKRNTFTSSITLAYTYKNLMFRNQLSIDINKADNGSYGSFESYAKMNPYWRIHDEDGALIQSYTPPGGGSKVGNPLYDASLNVLDQSKYDVVMNNFSIEWTILDGLIMRGKLGVSKEHNSADKFLPPSHSTFLKLTEPGDLFSKGSYNYRTGENIRLDGSATLNFVRTFAEKHQLVAGIDYSISSYKSTYYGFDAIGFTSDKLDFMANALQYAEGGRPYGNEEIIRRISYTGNLNYTYDNRYFADFSFRYDGSSLFGKDKRFAPFWSVGVGWNLHHESFLDRAEWLNNLRIRVSYGEVGSQQFSPYQALTTYRYYSDNRYMGWSAAELMGLGNDNLKWQSTSQFNVGFEVGVLNSRITALIDVYKKRTTNLLSSLDTPASTGFPSYIENVGKVDNKGFEASVSAFLIRNTQKKIIWSITGRIAYNKNEIVELSDAIKTQTKKYHNSTQASDRLADLLYEGQSVNSLYVVESLGIDPSTGYELFVDKNGNITHDWEGSARRHFGVSKPKYRGNISTYFAWKDLSVNLSFAYHWGGQQYNETLMRKIEVNQRGVQENLDRRILSGRWYNTGDVAYYKGYKSGGITLPSSRFVMDDNVFQLQSVSLTYRLQSPAMAEKIGINAMNFSLNMSNLFYFSSIKRERGIAYPFARTMSLSVSMLF